MNTPLLGRMLHVTGTPANGNGADVASAVITRVWSETLVNLTVFPDCGAPVPATSVTIVADEASARAINADSEYPRTLAWWPARV